MGLRKSSGFLEFKQLQLHDFEQFHEMIENGAVVCPNPTTWLNFYNKFVKKADLDKKLLPLILTSWVWTTNEEKNIVFTKQFEAISERYKNLGVRPSTWQKIIFDYFDGLEARQSELVVV